MVNSGNFAYVIFAKRSSAAVDRGTSSGVFPAAHRMFATLCVLNMCGASSHARTTASSSASPVSRDTTQRIVEMAQMMFESSMLLNPATEPGASMYSENARAVSAEMPYDASLLSPSCTTTDPSPVFLWCSCFFSTASAHIEFETPCGMNASPFGGFVNRSRMAPSSESVAFHTRASTDSSVNRAPGPLCIFASAHTALDRFCDENAAPSNAATLRNKLAKRFAQCAVVAPRAGFFPSTLSANISAVLPQFANPHRAQETSRAPQTPWNSSAPGCVETSGDANSASDAASAVSRFKNRGSSMRRDARLVRRPRAERFSFPSLWIAVEKFTAVNVRACVSAYSSTSSHVSHEDSVVVCCRIVFLRAAAAGDAGSTALFRPPRDPGGGEPPPRPPRPPWRRSALACAPEEVPPPREDPPRACSPRDDWGPRRPSP